jgi:minor tail protein
MSDTSMVYNVIAKDKASPVFERMGASAGKFFSVLLKAAPLIAVTKLGESFEDAYNKIRRQTGATGDALEILEKDFRNVLGTTSASMDSIATVMTDLAKRTRLTGVPLEDLTRQFVLLGKVTGTDVSASVGTMTRVFGAWNIKVPNQAATLDKMFRATQQTGIGIEQLGSSVTMFGPQLQGMGFSFEQSLALLGRFEQAGVNTGRVMMGMNSGLGKLAKAGKDPVKAFAEIQQKILHAKTAAEGTGIAVQIFGNRAGPMLANAIRSGKLEIGELTKTIASGSDTIAKAAGETKTFHDKLNMLRNKGFVLLEPVAMKVVDYLGQGADKLEIFGRWAARNQGWLKPLAATIAIVAASIVAVNLAMKIWTQVMAVWKILVTAATVLQWAWNIALNANPIGLIIIAVVALVAGIYLLWTHSAAFRNFFIGVWNDIWGFLKAVGAWFAGPFVNFFVGAWHWIQQHTVAAVLFIHAKIHAFMAFVNSIPGKIVAGFKATLTGVAEWVAGVYRSIMNGIIGVIDTALGFLNRDIISKVNAIPGVNVALIPLLPKLDVGGYVLRSGVAVVHKGETVTPAGRGGVTAVRVVLDVTGADEDMKRMIRKMVRADGGSVQLAFS